MLKTFSEFFFEKIAVVQIFRVLQVVNFQYCKCFMQFGSFRITVPLNVAILQKPLKCCQKVAVSFFEKFSCLAEIDKKKKFGMLQSLLIPFFFNELGAFHLVIMPAT